MRYVICWRIVVALAAFSLLLMPAFDIWQRHPSVLFGSPGISGFLFAYWWLIAMIGIASAILVGTVLMLFDRGAPVWLRLLCVALSFLLPVLPFYWLFRVELPHWRARRAA
jgi:hypothetical protein